MRFSMNGEVNRNAIVPLSSAAIVASGSPTSARKRLSTRLTNAWNESSSRERQPVT